MVAVELLPSHEWKGRTVALCENETEDKAPADTTGDPMPTGKVDQIIQCFIKITSLPWSDVCHSLHYTVLLLGFLSLSHLSYHTKFQVLMPNQSILT